MLSATKHLLFLVRNKQKQILRFAQDDRIEAFSPAWGATTTRHSIGIAAKLRGHSHSEDPCDLPACRCTPHRKIDGFIGNLTEQSAVGGGFIPP